jgi:hypothetical protein
MVRLHRVRPLIDRKLGLDPQRSPNASPSSRHTTTGQELVDKLLPLAGGRGRPGGTSCGRASSSEGLRAEHVEIDRGGKLVENSRAGRMRASPPGQHERSIGRSAVSSRGSRTGETARRRGPPHRRRRDSVAAWNNEIDMAAAPAAEGTRNRAQRSNPRGRDGSAYSVSPPGLVVRERGPQGYGHNGRCLFRDPTTRPWCDDGRVKSRLGIRPREYGVSRRGTVWGIDVDLM